jgi:hypothetical protein
VDQVTQWEIVAATPQISDLWLLPVLEALLRQLLFLIRGFHSDNGSEFINYSGARLLNKLLIEQTKSRPVIPAITVGVQKWSHHPQACRLWPYRGTTRRSYARISPAVP